MFLLTALQAFTTLFRYKHAVCRYAPSSLPFSRTLPACLRTQFSPGGRTEPDHTVVARRLRVPAAVKIHISIELYRILIPLLPPPAAFTWVAFCFLWRHFNARDAIRS